MTACQCNFIAPIIFIAVSSLHSLSSCTLHYSIGIPFHLCDVFMSELQDEFTLFTQLHFQMELHAQVFLVLCPGLATEGCLFTWK